MRKQLWVLFCALACAVASANAALMGQYTFNSDANASSLDANIQKTFRITESKSLSLRIDSTNVLNHPTPFIPYMAPGGQTGGGQFGEILCGCNDSKSGGRTFQGQVRFTF